MKTKTLLLATTVAFASLISSCTVMNKSMREPYSRIDFVKSDFTISEQTSGTGATTKVLCIDWYRLFHTTDAGTVVGESGGKLINFAKIPVVGGFITDKTANYALYDMMNKAPGYDIVFYPQFETKIRKPFLGLGFIYKKTTVKATARLAKFK